MDRFGVDVALNGEETLVAPRGELDLATVEALIEACEDALEEAAPRLLVDLRGLTFIDSTGLAALVRARESALRRGGGFALVRGTDEVHDVFLLTGLAEVFEFADPS